jgi:hypothetical protein
VKRIYTARFPTDAHMLADLLAREGIAVATRGTSEVYPRQSRGLIFCEPLKGAEVGAP